jgi:hypothetical protein
MGYIGPPECIKTIKRDWVEVEGTRYSLTYTEYDYENFPNLCFEVTEMLRESDWVDIGCWYAVDEQTNELQDTWFKIDKALMKKHPYLRTI